MAADAAPAITPPDGWCVQSPLGVLKTDRGVCLVRLEDVHAWLMQRDGLPSASAVARVFSVFASDSASDIGIKHGAGKVRESLFLIDLSGYAESVRGFAGQHFLGEVADLVPYVPHHHFDKGTLAALMYTLGLMAGEVWAPHECEIDLDERLSGYCAEGYFPSVAKSREVLGRFAVSFAAANALWGWGTIAAPVAAPASAPSAAVLALVHENTSPAPAPAQPAKVPMKAQAPEWTGEKLAQKRKTLKGRDTTVQLVKITGLSDREIRRREKDARDEVENAQRAGKSKAA